MDAIIDRLLRDTLCRIESVHEAEGHNGTPIAEIRTSLGEAFAVFSPSVREACKQMQLTGWKVDLTIRQARHSQTRYVESVRGFDPSAPTQTCLCGAEAARAESIADNGQHQLLYECPSCHRRLFITDVPRVDVHLPTKARARLDRLTDALFVLDHEQKDAILIDTFTSWGVPNMEPFAGVIAEIAPHADVHTPQSIDGQQLRLMGTPFNGDAIYTISSAPILLLQREQDRR